MNLRDNDYVPPVTLTLSILVLVVFVVQAIVMFALGDYPRFPVLQDKQPMFPAVIRLWSLSPVLLFVASPFLHGSVAHVAKNLAGLLIFGRAMERESEWRFYALFFLVSVYLTSAATTYVKMKYGSPFPYSVGISGGVFAVLGFLAVYYLPYTVRKVLEGEESVWSAFDVLRVVYCLFGVSAVIGMLYKFLTSGFDGSSNTFAHALGGVFGVVVVGLGLIGDTRNS